MALKVKIHDNIMEHMALANFTHSLKTEEALDASTIIKVSVVACFHLNNIN